MPGLIRGAVRGIMRTMSVAPTQYQDDHAIGERQRERIGLMKHLGTVSLAAFLYVAAEFENSWAFKWTIACLLLSMVSSIAAYVLYVADMGQRRSNDVRRTLKAAVALTLFGLICGIALLTLSILFV